MKKAPTQSQRIREYLDAHPWALFLAIDKSINALPWGCCGASTIMQMLSQKIPLKRPNLVLGVLSGDLPPKSSVEVFRAGARTFADDRVTVFQGQQTGGKGRIGENVVLLGCDNLFKSCGGYAGSRKAFVEYFLLNIVHSFSLLVKSCRNGSLIISRFLASERGTG